ncbi:MAG: hypothetical protein ACP5P3_02165 [Ignavibacteria bacterium]
MIRNSLITRILIIWIVIHSIFIWWWYPSNLEFWIQILPAVVILFALSYSNITTDKVVNITSILVLFLISILIWWNFPVILELKNMHNEYICSSQNLKDITNNKDLVITAGFGKQYSYLRYFLNAKVYSLHGIRQTNSGNLVTNRVMDQLDSLFKATMSENGSIFITEDLYSLNFPTYRSLVNFDKNILKSYFSTYRWQSITLCNVLFYKKL